MRYPRDHKERTRRRILRAAARRFRQKGFAGAGVDSVMRTAGLTAGGFYAHFGSKEALLAEALALAEAQVQERLLAGIDDLEGIDWLREVIRRYLSRGHRDDVAKGCVLPTLTAEAPRLGGRARASLEAYVRRIADGFEAKTAGLPGLEPKDRVLATIALCAGGLMLARAVRDEELSDRILLACRRLALPEDMTERGQSGATGGAERPEHAHRIKEMDRGPALAARRTP
jgi:TetR/AcrR family transcriptional repressor of nem operon